MGFLSFVKSMHVSIKFTMEAEGKQPFVDVLVYWKLDDSLGHKVYRKSMPTDLYLIECLQFPSPSTKEVGFVHLDLPGKGNFRDPLQVELSYSRGVVLANGDSSGEIQQTIMRLFSDKSGWIK